MSLWKFALVVSALLGLLLPPASRAQSFDSSGPRKRISAPGALLDDYEVAEPGSFSFTFAAGYLKVPNGYDVWMPASDLSIGITRWMDISLYSSVSKNSFDTFRTTALGDSYINARFVVLREGRRRPGIAFQPVLEVLGRPSLANNPAAPDKVNAAFGGMIGKNLWQTVRVYNHSGYFTRGIAFSSAAMEVIRFSRFTPVVFATFGALTSNRETAAEMLANASRLDMGGTIGFRLAKNWSAYVSGSRSLGRRDYNSTTVAIGGGITWTWRPWSE